ncbi:MAG: chloride channel protein [Alphaproteobacteria bacterium]|nr:chloride channel protein [Alphaproteobacteria bacterium]MDE2341256.1 chloride channel protein [Alphaproteobacteria bacterium]
MKHRLGHVLRARGAALTGAVLLSIVAIIFARSSALAFDIFSGIFRAHPLLPLILTPAIVVAVTYITLKFAPEAKGSGIPQVMAASHRHKPAGGGQLLSLRTAGFKISGTIAMLLAGGAVGREGPTVQISAAVLTAVYRWFRVPVTSGVIIAGGAAGVAAAFNTPLAGVAFAIEELASAFEQRVAVYVMATVMLSGLVSLGLDGDYVYFGAMSVSLSLRSMLMIAPVAGILGGLAGGLYARTLVAFSWSRAPIFRAARQHPLVSALICGLIIALTGEATHGLSWGTGYETTQALLKGHTASLLFGPGKFIASLATALSGAPGGIFAPSLSVGAGLGQLIAQMFPGASPGAIVLLGMVGYFTGVVRAPLTAVIIMMEMTANRTMILTLFATALIADGVSAQIMRPKLYHTLSRRFHHSEADTNPAR